MILAKKTSFRTERGKLFTVILLTVANRCLSQDPAVGFEAATRLDFIGLHNHDRKNYGLLHGETDITAMLNTESLRLFRGGELSFQLRGIFVDKSSGDFVGYLQVFSNIENGFRIFLYQAYYKYTINKFIVKPGQLAYNADLLSHEPAIELTFKKYITTNIIFQPDFQYIINPGATSAAVNNSFIGLARLMLVY